ncbi:MAG: alpha/beta hydrolase [Pseudomonadota bacterium]
MAADFVTAQDWVDQGAYLRSRSRHNHFYRQGGHGDTIILLHGMPTWSYDYAAICQSIEEHYETISMDFLGFGQSDKPKAYNFNVKQSADAVEDLLSRLGRQKVHLVAHDFGTLVSQELLQRHRKNTNTFEIQSVTAMNCSIVFELFRPTRLMKLTMTPIIGALVALMTKKERVRPALDAARGIRKFTDTEFEELWKGISKNGGHKISHRLFRYNKERAKHADQWEQALYDFEGPVQLIWGIMDPVSGGHILEALRSKMPRAKITSLQDVGHFPPLEAPKKVASAILAFLEER